MPQTWTSMADGFPKGTICLCPDCWRPVFALERGLSLGDRGGRSASAFRPITRADLQGLLTRPDLNPTWQSLLRAWMVTPDLERVLRADRPRPGDPAICPNCEGERMILSDAPRPMPEAIVVGIPTFGMVSIYWHLQIGTMFHQFKPMNRILTPCVVKGKRVDVARNEIVRHALDMEATAGVRATHVFFIDDDVLITPDGLLRLLEHDLPIVSGLYYAKTPVLQPLVFTEPHKGAATNWTPGELVDCYAHGMGYTLIQTEVFRAMGAGPWFQTTEGQITGQTFKQQTEDVFFCEQATEAGYQPRVDTGLLGIHYDSKQDVGYPLDAWDGFKNSGAIRVPVAA